MNIKNTFITGLFFVLGIGLLFAQTTPIAQFSASPTIGNNTPLTVFFTDQSTLPDTWQWNFGDGFTSTAKNPIHTYNATGAYTVTLKVGDTVIGTSDIITKVDFIKISKPVANFVGNQSFGCAPFHVNFSDTSVANGAPIVNWLWDFGDGTTSSDQNPSHSYQNSGNYTVILTVTDSFGNSSTDTFTNMIQVIGPNLEFDVNHTLLLPNDNVVFSNTSTSSAPIVNWQWNFGDGSPVSNVQNPTHIYTAPGDYTLSLTATDLDGCSRTLTKTSYIKVVSPENIIVGNDTGLCNATITLPNFEYSSSGNAILLDGTNDYVETPLPALFNAIATTDFTIEMWVNRTAPSSSTSRLLFAQLDGANFVSSLVNSSGILYFFVNENGITHSVNTSYILPINQWVHTAFIWNATTKSITVLINGSPQATSNGGGSSSGQNNSMTIGSRTDGAQFFRGKIDEIRIWNLQRSNADIIANMNTCVLETNANLVAYYKLDETIGSSTTIDATGNGNDGTLINCDVNTAWNTGNVSCGLYAINDITNSNNASGIYPLGNTTVNWTVSNNSGDTVNCTQIVTVEDNENPVITCPSAVTLTADAGLCTSSASIGMAIATDNCGSPTLTNDAPTAFPIGNTTVTWTATDNAGNTATCTQIVTVEDNENPVITCPSAITLTADAGLCTSSASIGMAIATDNCGNPTLTNDAPTVFPIGNTTVTWTATDNAGNTATCTQIVTVEDNENPVITCPSAVTLTSDVGLCTSSASIGMAIATDNCGTPTLTNDAPTVFPIGNTTVTWTATDNAGNTATCTQLVTVEDNENPVITCPSAVTLTADAGLCTSSASIGMAIATDNCGNPTLTNDAPTVFPIGNTTVTWTATDNAGNTATCTQIVTVEDNENPVITCPSAVTLTADAGLCTSSASIGMAIATDNCGTPTLTNDAPTVFPIGNTTVTWTATDNAGNTATCTQIVTVEDNENPVITCTSAVTLTTDAGLCTSSASIGMAIATDNCGNPTLTNDAPTTFPIGNTIVTWIATDNAGNTATCTQIVTVEDNENPTAIAQNITLVLDNFGNAILTPSMVDNGSYDNCSLVSMTLDKETFNCTDVDIPVVVTLTVIDASGNNNSATALVTIQDNSLPVVLTQDITIPLDTFGNATVTPQMIDNGSYDNCGIQSFQLNVDTFSCPRLDESQLVTLTVIDSHGNSATGNAYVSFTGFDLDLDGIADPCDVELNPDVTPVLGISPNDDSENDTWVIENITNFPQAKVEIFDRNGVEVFNATNYQNDWSGKRNNTGELVPVGSYYFVINIFGDGSLFIKGWLYINY
ncbi:conserved hypothetical protein [Flavobacterium sp. 9AF]|uniref:HYR domain-containing protein n=1 Tax=Flavobacterium sp. 9AF TaxID=2653142 RepID=UPI0012F0A66A|nr:HYR domain-containing protein [Flavobacterium sp. 9AF]VXC39146.1 conserved hypothetical protein [Flavobacterium sp. 9AF]